jgi:hypothetical protein
MRLDQFQTIHPNVFVEADLSGRKQQKFVLNHVEMESKILISNAMMETIKVVMDAVIFAKMILPLQLAK